jgi:hypothetical protein
MSKIITYPSVNAEVIRKKEADKIYEASYVMKRKNEKKYSLKELNL